LRLPPKITLSVVRLEEGSDRSVAVESQERAARPIKPGDRAVVSRDLEDLASGGLIAKLLRRTKVFGFADISELRAVLGEMLVELIPGAKASLCARASGLRHFPRLSGSRQLTAFVAARDEADRYEANHHCRADGDPANTLHKMPESRTAQPLLICNRGRHYTSAHLPRTASLKNSFR